MLLGSLAELPLQMTERPLGEKVYDLSSAGRDPVDGLFPVHEAESLDPVDEASLRGPGADPRESVPLALRNTRRADLYPVDLQVLQQEPAYRELLGSVEGNACGLLSVAESRVEYLYHDLLFSNASILSLVESR